MKNLKRITKTLLNIHKGYSLLLFLILLYKTNIHILTIFGSVYYLALGTVIILIITGLLNFLLILYQYLTDYIDFSDIENLEKCGTKYIFLTIISLFSMILILGSVGGFTYMYYFNVAVFYKIFIITGSINILYYYYKIIRNFIKE